jgi:hypothetical protein
MQVDRDHRRTRLQELFEPRERFELECARPVGVEIADVLRQHHLPAMRQRDGVLQVRTESEHGLHDRVAKLQRLGNVTARAPHERRFLTARTHDRVVAAPHDLAIVHEQDITLSREQRARLLRRAADRLVVRVARSHHERVVGRPAEQLDVQRRRREHHAHVDQSRRDQRVQGTLDPRHEQDRSAR